MHMDIFWCQNHVKNPGWFRIFDFCLCVFLVKRKQMGHRYSLCFWQSWLVLDEFLTFLATSCSQIKQAQIAYSVLYYSWIIYKACCNYLAFAQNLYLMISTWIFSFSPACSHHPERDRRGVLAIWYSVPKLCIHKALVKVYWKQHPGYVDTKNWFQYFSI